MPDVHPVPGPTVPVFAWNERDDDITLQEKSFATRLRYRTNRPPATRLLESIAYPFPQELT